MLLFPRVLVLLVLLGAPAVCLARQTPQSPAIPATESSIDPAQALLNQRYAELLVWLDQYRDWEAWTLKWGNRIARNAAGGIVKERPSRPEPPEWLWEDCANVLAPDGALGEACRVLASWDHLVPTILARRTIGGISQPSDTIEKSSFLQRIHLTAGWVPAQLPTPKMYLAVGMQVGVVELGRVTLPAVGVGLVALANNDGGYDWKPATVLGIGYRLASFPFPGIHRLASLHINVARVTVHGVRNLPIGLDPSQNFVGFSLTFKKAR